MIDHKHKPYHAIMRCLQEQWSEWLSGCLGVWCSSVYATGSSSYCRFSLPFPPGKRSLLWARNGFVCSSVVVDLGVFFGIVAWVFVV